MVQKSIDTKPSGVATGWQGGHSATPDSEKIAKNREKSGKNQEKIRKKEEKLGRKGKNREVSFTLPLLTDRAGYATDKTNLDVNFYFCISTLSREMHSYKCKLGLYWPSHQDIWEFKKWEYVVVVVLNIWGLLLSLKKDF